MSKQDNALREVGLKVTSPRVKILQLLEEAEENTGHLGAEDIYKLLSEVGQDVSLATVYRVLSQFESAGLIVRHHFAGDRSVFELVKEDHHDHMICVTSGQIIEFVDPIIEKRQCELAEQYGFELIDHRLVLYVKPKHP